MTDPNHIPSLHKYFIWADTMRKGFYARIATDESKKDRKQLGFDIKAFMYMSLWYALLYVVVEGWQELKLSDSRVDSLLNSGNLEKLKRYRHGVFHFQRDYFDHRYFEFIDSSENPVEWVRDLHDALGNVLLSLMKKHWPDTGGG